MQHKETKVFIIFSSKYLKANLINTFILHWIHHSSIYTRLYLYVFILFEGRNKILKKCFKNRVLGQKFYYSFKLNTLPIFLNTYYPSHIKI